MLRITPPTTILGSRRRWGTFACCRMNWCRWWYLCSACESCKAQSKVQAMKAKMIRRVTTSCCFRLSSLASIPFLFLRRRCFNINIANSVESHWWEMQSRQWEIYDAREEPVKTQDCLLEKASLLADKTRHIDDPELTSEGQPSVPETLLLLQLRGNWLKITGTVSPRSSGGRAIKKFTA